MKMRRRRLKILLARLGEWQGEGTRLGAATAFMLRGGEWRRDGLTSIR